VATIDLARDNVEKQMTVMLNDHCAISRKQDGTVTLTIREAGRANVLSSPVIKGLTEGISLLATDEALRVLILASGGERSFIAGADITEMAKLNPETGESFIKGLRNLCEAVRCFPAPVVARIQGWCLGGGLELAMACDMRVAAPEAKFGMPEVRVGIPSVIHAALMPRLIGEARARRLILTGAAIDAATALDWGLIDFVSTSGDLDRAVADAIAPILACGPAVIAAQKALMNQWAELSLAEAVAVSVPAFGRAFATGEPQRYMRQFIDEKAGRAR
jgi:enoyl-CoA hydratase/carnithine racemase